MCVCVCVCVCVWGGVKTDIFVITFGTLDYLKKDLYCKQNVAIWIIKKNHNIKKTKTFLLDLSERQPFLPCGKGEICTVNSELPFQNLPHYLRPQAVGNGIF